MNERYSVKTLAIEIATVSIGLLFMVPFYFVLVNSLKTNPQILIDASSWPKEFRFENYTKAWALLRFPSAFLNSLLITSLSNAGLVAISSMAAWKMVRTPNAVSRCLFIAFVAAMVIPFQTVMIPLVKIGAELGVMNSIIGLAGMYYGFGVSLTLFLYHGFVKSVPHEIEESASIDGCTTFGVFWKIVFPLLKPITVTVIILNTLWIWNDYLLPSLVLQSAELRTIPLATSSLFAQYQKQWDMGLSALVLGTAPVVLFFLSLQKHIIRGIVAGSGK